MKKILVLLVMVFTLGFTGISQGMTKCVANNGDLIVNFEAHEVDGTNHAQLIFIKSETWFGISAIYLTIMDPTGAVVLYDFWEPPTDDSENENDETDNGY